MLLKLLKFFEILNMHFFSTKAIPLSYTSRFSYYNYKRSKENHANNFFLLEKKQSNLGVIHKFR